MNAYVSTRDPQRKVSAKEAVLQGISPEGGLFVQPALGEKTIDITKLTGQSYFETAKDVLALLLEDYTEEEIEDCLQKAYGASFSSPDITPVREVDGVQVLELFHGPTSAFKDVALTLLPQLMSKALAETGKKALILTATSGDTGKAAMSGFEDAENTGICVFYPHGKVSDIQYRQMACQTGKNVAVFAIEGNFDDAQTNVKQLFLDEDLRKELDEKGIVLSSANSINIGRLIPQIVYYFQAYKDLLKRGVIAMGEEISFSVPTGNFGDVLAGYYAKLLGLPVKKFIVASNENNVLTDFINTGRYDRRRPFHQTISPSMDILISSNLERLLYYASGKDSQKVAQWMKQLQDEGWYQVDDKTLKAIQSLFEAAWLDDEGCRKAIKEAYDASHIVLDTHTAIGWKAAKASGLHPIVSLATASPYKFAKDVLEALQIESDDCWQALDKLADICQDPIPAPLAKLKDSPVLHTAVISPDEMKDAVRKGASLL